MKTLGGFVLCSLVTLVAASAQDSPFWPNADYDPAIPTFEDVLGHAPGERIVNHQAVLTYMRALSESAPDRMAIHTYAETWEGRELIYAVLASPENLRRIATIREGVQRLADPRLTDASEADNIIRELPAVTWLSYAVHGNEISSTDAGMLTAYHLLAALDDPLVDVVFDNTVVVIDPLQNPDGRERFVHNFEIARGLEPDPSPLAAEHDEPWPGGRTNHYYFDMNRDWFALTQPETRGRVRILQEWFPVAFVDGHEMGSSSTYFFSPEAVPFNPHLVQPQIDKLELFGKNNARYFDDFGFDYFTREIYDAFYPGYGASWPSYHGSVAMTYEQASPRGLVIRQDTGSLLHFREAVRHHFVASLSTAEVVARNRETFLRDFYEYRVSAIEEGKSERVKEYILPFRGDTALVTKLAALLVEQGVEVKRATEAFTAGSDEYPEGTYVVSAAQPAKRLIRNLLDDDVPMEADFIEEQERRRAKRLPDQIYDVTAWSLPLMFNVECIERNAPSRGAFEPVKPERIHPGRVTGGPAQVAYLVPWDTAGAHFLAQALRRDVQVWSSDKAFTQGDREYPRGTLIVKVEENDEALHETMGELVHETGATVYATDSGWVDEGVNFGSAHVHKIPKARVAMAWDRPTAAYNAGATRFVLERQFGYPVSAIRTDQLGRGDLRSIDVIILPAEGGGSYQTILGESGAKNLQEWVESGGTLVAIGNALTYLAEIGVLDIKREQAARDDDEMSNGNSEEEDEVTVPGTVLETEEDYRSSIQPEEEPPYAVAGVLAEAVTDQEHWSTAGAPDTVNVLVTGREIFSPMTLDNGVNAVRFAGPDDLVSSGYIWDDNRRQLAYKPFMVVQERGRGVVIGFTEDPNFRAYMDGLNVLFIGAVFRGAAHADPLR